MKVYLLLVVYGICFFAIFIVEAVPPIQTAKLKIKMSARNLIDKDDFSTTDGYVVVYYTNDGGRTIKKLGRSEIVFDKRNPDWNSVFEFHFDRKLKQYWFFHVYDADLALDDTVGRVWVNVADYVDKREVAHVNLDKGGYLTIRDATIPEKSAKVSAGILPFPKGTPNSKRIRFYLAARGLSKNTNNHETIIVTCSEGVNGRERIVGKASTVTGSLSPSWKQAFTLNWNKRKDQRLHFKIYDAPTGDTDTLIDKYKIADGWIEVNDYIARGESYTVLFPTKGTLTMHKL